MVSIERHAELSAHAAAVLQELGYQNVQLVVGDGTLGWPAAAPYDRILVAAATDVVPPPLVDQLRDGGILVIPLGDALAQSLVAIRKADGRLETRELTACRFVPLVGSSPPEDGNPAA